ncbi:hypothetical protein ABT340_04625 [Streptosporangium sp. NPDC000239]|uniref:hypothetical protein n=1 Tax=Streptosporangium sp. NPDC000239 TaxID=3154248 RepID=UPI00332B0336
MAIASVRSVAATPIQGASSTASRGEVRVGDLLIAFHSSDAGAPVSSLSIAGGGVWQTLTSAAGSGWSGTKIYYKTATADEPDTYTVTQGGTGPDVVVFILAVRAATSTGIMVAQLPGTTAPALAPSAGSGLEIRYGAGVPQVGGSVFWAQLPGYDGLDLQSTVWMTGSLAVRQAVSSAPLDPVDMAPIPALTASHAFTIFVPSVVVEQPGTPTFPAFTPGKGVAFWRFTVHDFLTGGYRGDITPSQCTFDRRIAAPGNWTGTVPIPNATEGRRIDEIIPRDVTDLRSGPGRIVVHCWRQGVLWGIYWIHTAVTERSERGTVTMQLQGTTLDGYLHSVALTADLALEGDQLDVARALVLHMQATPGSDIGLSLQPGLSGVERDLEARVDDFYGRVLENYARATNGFESVVNPRVVDGAIIRSMEFGSPKIVNPDGEHVFVEAVDGGDIVTWREQRSALLGGTRYGVVGGTPPATDVTRNSSAVRSGLVVTPHVAAGWPIVDKRIPHPTASTDLPTLDDYAAYWASRAPGAPPVFSASVILGTGSTLGPNSLGDMARFILHNPRYPLTAEGGASFNLRQRLLAWSITPSTRGVGKDRVDLVTEQEAPE